MKTIQTCEQKVSWSWIRHQRVRGLQHITEAALPSTSHKTTETPESVKRNEICDFKNKIWGKFKLYG